MRKRLLLGIIGLAVVALLLSVAFWDTLVIYFSPKTILYTAISEAVAQLQQRFEKDPMLMMLDVVDPQGRQTANLNLEVQDPYLGEIAYDMQVQLEPCRLFGEGMIRSRNLALDLSVFADTEFMAISSKDLSSGMYYGITYETFYEDIRDIPLLSWMIGESVLQKWDRRVVEIQGKMENWISLPAIPIVRSEDLQNMMLYALTVPADVEKDQYFVNGEDQKVFRIDVSLNEPGVRPYLSGITGIDPAEEMDTLVSFYLLEKKLIAVNMTVKSAGCSVQLSLELGADALRDPISAVITRKEGETVSQQSIQIQTISGDLVLCQRWEINNTDPDQALSISYEWDPSVNALRFSIDDREMVKCFITQTQDGLRMESDDFSSLLNCIQQKEGNGQIISGSIELKKGAEIEQPQYKNLDQWSLEDLLILLEGVGTLLGFGFE